ncbi:MAG: flagellar biosynthesis anti-sigma factor FlgM [Deltaproteobacteria bacterium]|nr:flagellar biosynthesis anti-sigma factor FlgM [Deltaproteobacteria bacterium]
MRITDKNALVELTSYLRGTENAAQKQDVNVKETSKTAADRVDISQRSKDIQKAREAVEAVPDVRENKVNDIKKSIEDKTYNVKGEAVANSIIKKSLIDTVL